MSLNQRKFDQSATHYRKIMENLGIDMKCEHNKDTPRRVIRMLTELTSGVGQVPAVVLPLFKNKGDQLVVVSPIPFSSMCAHHHSPFIGHAAVGYLPDKHITGISKFKRVIDHFASRPQTQEDLVNDVADFLQNKLHAHAFFVFMKAKHTCMGARGIRTPCSDTYTHAVRGSHLELNTLKTEFLSMIMRDMP